MRINIFDIIVLIFFIGVTIFSILKTYLIKKISGEIIVRKRFSDNIILRIFIKAILVISILAVIYFTYKDNDFSHITNLLIISFPNIFLNFISSTQFYTIYENGLCLGFYGFSKWEDIKKYELKKDGCLIFKTNKKGIPGEIKIKEENIKIVEELLEKNMVLPIL